MEWRHIGKVEITLWVEGSAIGAGIAGAVIACRYLYGG